LGVFLFTFFAEKKVKASHGSSDMLKLYFNANF